MNEQRDDVLAGLGKRSRPRVERRQLRATKIGRLEEEGEGGVIKGCKRRWIQYLEGSITIIGIDEPR